jgi:hypothetical protein
LGAQQHYGHQERRQSDHRGERVVTETKITISAIPDNRPEGCRVSGHRQPLVHIMAHDLYHELQSFTFHPKHARAFIKAVREAAKAAREDREIDDAIVVVEEYNG